MSKIRVINGPYRGREKSLADKPVTIGRDAEAGVQILDRSASRFHAEIFPVGGMFFVRDLESKNGTYVNDEKIGDEELLRERDVIKIGSTELIFEGGAALTDDDSSHRIAYRDDPDILSNTLEFRLDELSDISESSSAVDHDNARSLRALYQIGRMQAEARPSEVEGKVLAHLVHTMPAECAIIFRREGPSGRLVPATVRTSAPLIQPVISRSIIKKTFSENKALHIANAQADERFDRSASVVQKGIRSVLCVPLAVGGQTRGVLYLSRGENSEPFTNLDLELVSAVAIQIGLSQHAHEQQRRHRDALSQVLSGLVRSLEAKSGVSGSGERCARFCRATAEALRLDGESRDRLTHAGLFHHLPRLCGDSSTAIITALQDIDSFAGVLPLLTGTDAAEDVEAQVLAACSFFEARTSAEADADVNAIIEALRADPAYDPVVTTALHACHLDGSLYSTKTVPSAATPPA